MTALTRRIGQDVFNGLILVTSVATVCLAAPSWGEPDRPAASDVPGHRFRCLVCRLPRYGDARSPSQFGTRPDGADPSSPGAVNDQASDEQARQTNKSQTTSRAI